MNWLYTLGIHAYQGAVRLAALRPGKARAMLRGRRQALPALAALRAKRPGARPVWLHAASLGEFEQGRPLLERLRRERPDIPIVLSFFSPSGFEVRRGWEGADAVVYLPGDTPRAMRRFIEAVDPRMAIIVKYEFWGNMLAELRRRRIPAYLIAAVFRPSQSFFKPWGGAWRAMLRSLAGIYVQDRESAELLRSIGIKDAVPAGDTRFDRVTDIMRATREIPELDRLTRGGTRLCFMAGSSWGPDEEVYFPYLKARAADMMSVIAPHEFDAARLQAMRRALAPEVRAVLLSEARARPALLEDAQCLIIDCFGLLSSAYRYAQIAYVGGGFGAGIHNINEAAVYGIPVLFGPRHGKFLEARGLIEAGGAFSVDSAEALRRVMDARPGLMKPAPRGEAGARAAAYIRAHTGATPLIYSRLFPD